MLRSPSVAIRLRDIRRHDREHGTAREDLLWRIDCMGETALDSPARLNAFRDVILAFCPPGFRFRPDYDGCAVSARNGGVIVITGELWDHGERAASIQRVLAVGRRIAWHEYLRTHGEFKGTALAPVVLRQSFMYFDRVGIDRARVHAALETGVYYWASCGFDFRYDHEREAVRRHFRALLQALGRSIDVSGLTAAYQFANIGRDTDEMTSFKEMAEAVAAMTGAPVPDQAFADRAVENNLVYDEPVPLAKGIFLLFSDWHGELNLDPKGGQRTLFETWALSKIRQTAH
jgi:hypothetical protein